MRSYTIPHSIMRQIEAGSFDEFRKTLQDFEYDSIILTEYTSQNVDWPGQLLKALDNIPIISIDLSNNNIDPQCATAIANNLHYVAQLRVLKLDRNHIRDAGATALAERFKDTPQLLKLNFYCNDIRDAGATALAKSFKDTTQLCKLNFYCNPISDAGAIALAKSLKGIPHLTQLNLRVNDISDIGAAALVKSIKDAPQLKQLNLSQYRNPMHLQLKKLKKQYLGFNQRKADLLRLRHETTLNPPPFSIVAANDFSNNNSLVQPPQPPLIFSPIKNKRKRTTEVDRLVTETNDFLKGEVLPNKRQRKTLFLENH